jgi:hypothetical protein
MILGLIAAMLGGQSLATVLSGLGVAGIIKLIAELAQLEPVAAALVAQLHPTVAAIFSQIGEGVEHLVIAQSVQEWAAENGQAAIKLAEQRDASH